MRSSTRSEYLSEPLFRAWLAVAAPDVDLGPDPLVVEPMPGGRSNITLKVTSANGAWVLRQPPSGGVLRTAHDMDREWAFISALTGSRVPVARPLARNRAYEVMPVDCYLTEFVTGTVLHSDLDAASLTESARYRVGDAMVEVLAELHRIDPDTAGLDNLRRPGSHLGRQLRRWLRQVGESALADLQLIHTVHERLEQTMPSVAGETLCHGDFRPGNLSFGTSGEVVAVFDWELATIGDPLTDLGYLLASWGRPADDFPAVGSGPAPTRVDGFVERARLVERYALLSRRDVSALPYYVAFARWRAACIGAGVYTRYASGVMGEVDSREKLLRDRLELITGLLDAAMAELDEWT
jgi:aminoglycoside phosphotransferase (APT) family kinase protein